MVIYFIVFPVNLYIPNYSRSIICPANGGKSSPWVHMEYIVKAIIIIENMCIGWVVHHCSHWIWPETNFFQLSSIWEDKMVAYWILCKCYFITPLVYFIFSILCNLPMHECEFEEEETPSVFLDDLHWPIKFSLIYNWNPGSM